LIAAGNTDKRSDELLPNCYKRLKISLALQIEYRQFLWIYQEENKQ